MAIITTDTFSVENDLTAFLNDHGLPAKQVNELFISTRDQYVDINRIYHDEPILIRATWAAVREFLGY